MEGGVEGMVAVVTWLSDAGLAFNLLRNSRQCRPPQKLPASRPSRNPSNAVASQTVSEHNYKRRRLSPEPYASTYQVSHCGVDTRSSACEHTEFPPQRQKPSEFGNFEVGNIRCHSPARSDIHNYRGNFDTLGTRGCQFRLQQERDVDEFVSSLRKYPNVTEHLPSTQLLEQLLKTSRNHSPKQSHAPAPSKKRRHHWDKPRPFASLSPYAHKQKESYRRLRKKKHTNAHVDSKEKEYSLQGGLVSVTAFDYLNSGARSSAGNLTKSIENTIFKNVFRVKNRDKGRPVTAFPVCPTLQSRYEKHLKKYHATTSKTPHVDLENLPTCSKCLLKRPCPCEAAKRVRRHVDKDVQEIRQFEDAIFSWLKDIPVYPNENPQDKFIRDDIVKKLAETLSKFNDADFAIKGKEEIKRALDKMPMWYPKGENERENFINDIVDNLLEKINGVQEMKMFNQATKDFFDDIKFGKEVDAQQALDDIIRELNKIALNRPENNDIYRDLLKMKAFELLDGLQIKSNGNKYEYLNKLSNELADRLLNVSIKSKDAEHKINLDNAIKNMLDETNVRIKDRDNVEKKLQAVIADVVAQNIDKDEAEIKIKSILDGKVPDSEIENIANKTLTLAEISQNATQIDPETIVEDIRDILDLANVQIKNRANLEKDLSQLVSDINTNNIEENKAKSKIKSILKGQVPEDKLAEITEQVLILADRVKPVDDEMKQVIKGDVRDILSDVQIKNSGKVEKDLSKLIADITAKGIDKDQAETQIKALLKGKVPEDKLKEITEQVLTVSDRAKPIDEKTKQVIKGDVRDILADVQIKNRENVEENLSKLIADINAKGIDKDQAETQIKALLKGKVPEDKLKEITEQVLTVSDRAKPIDDETKQVIKGDVRDILADVQIKNRGKVEEDLSKFIADITAKGIDKDQAETQIKALLKGKVPEDKLKEITEQVLTVSDRAKPIDDETKQVIKADVRDILSDVQIKNRGKLEENLSTFVADIIAKDIDKDQAETQIKALLKGKVPEDALEDITEQALKLADRVKPLDTETKQIIKEDIQDIFDNSNIQIKNRGKVEENLTTLVANISKGMGKDKAITQIKSLLKDTVPENKQEEITKKILSLATKIKPKLKSIDLETKQNIDKQLSDILYQSAPYIKDKRKVEEKLRSLVSDILMKKVGTDKAKQSIKSILKGEIPKDKVENTILKVLELAKNIEDNQSMHYPISEETLKEDISDILDRTNVRIKNRDIVEKHLHDIISDLVMRGLDKVKAQDYINSTLKGNVPDSQVEEISKKIFALAENVSRSYSEYSDGPVASSTQNEEKILFDQVFEVIRDWLKNLNIHLSNNKLNEVAEAIANETLDRRKYLQLNPGVKISEAKESEILKEQIYKVLNNLIDKKLVQSIMTQADDLMNSLKQIPNLQVSEDYSQGLVQDSKQFVQENLEGALLDWLRQSPIYLNKDLRNKQTQEQIMIELAESLAAVLGSQAIQKPGTNLDEALLKEISKHIERFPLGPEFKSKEHIRKLCNHILDYLKKIQLFQDISARDSQRTKSSFMSSTNQLNDIVKDWCDALPLSDTDGAFRIKQDLANRIILKVGEMNMNQDIFNDDLLYDEILQDFIDQQVNELPIEKDITDVSKKILIDQIKQIKQKIQDDFIGRKYKQQLRDTISNILPSMACPTAEDLASFELMKENLADAFINLNYSVEDDTARAKFKRRIMDEVNKYVNDYLKRCPATPVSTRKLNEDLYNALKNVPVPGDESMRTEVESVRMKDVINGWLKTLPMSRQSISEQLHTNKVVTLMAQKLQELENEFHPDFEAIAVAEIATYLKKLPLNNKNNLQEMAKKLVDKIKNTAESRAFVEGTRSKLTDDCLCEDFALPCIPRRISYPSCASFIPPCGLSKEDQEKMQRIRERAVLCEVGTQSRRCRDAAVNPPPLNHESQTDMPCNNNKYCQHAEKPEHVCCKSATLRTKRIPISTRPCPSTSGQADCSPYVVVKEYYWDSNLGNKVEFATQTPVEESGRICIPSSFLNTERLCRPRSTLTSRRVPVKQRSRPEASTCQRPTPRRQFTSACPNEFFNRPKHCPRSPLVPDYLRSSYRCVGPSCTRGRMKSPCLSCKRDPTTICDKCFPMHVCPHPTCLYFK
ncbi:uncharacterized protein LOC134748281 [Cydia strobilella]|uniref:uncharacterized protein LOC134748281 n=1 Tax=Cydia strobilella TaxID=1100964 RepID=UPI00300737E4